MTVNTDAVNIQSSNLAALERIAEKNPALASQILNATNEANKLQFKQYKVGAVVSGVVAITVLACSTYVIASQGFWAGIAFFLACVGVSAITSLFLTGKSQDLSWTVGFISRKSDTESKG